MAVRAKRKVRKALETECCCRADCSEPAQPGSRGLCKQHKNQFDYAKKLCRTATAKRVFDDEQVKLGNVLASARGRCRKIPCPYLKSVG